MSSLPYAIQALSVVLSCCISSLRKFVSFNLTCVYPFPINTPSCKTFPFVSSTFFSFFIERRQFLSTPFSWCVELNFNSSSKCSPSGLRQVCAVVQVDCKEISTLKILEGRKEGSHDVVDQLFVPICIISRFSFYIHSGILDTVIIHFHWVVFDYFKHKFLNRVLLVCLFLVFGFPSFLRKTLEILFRDGVSDHFVFRFCTNFQIIFSSLLPCISSLCNCTLLFHWTIFMILLFWFSFQFI